MEQSCLEIPFLFLHNKHLNIFDSVVLSYIRFKSDLNFLFRETNNEIATNLNIKISSLPTVIDKLFKLGYIEIHFENKQRIITYTYDAPHKLTNSGYIYVMKDETHSYLKIGFSKDPRYRESTLQGEKPTISLVAKFKGTIQQEQTCHRILARYRKRGEWFEVDLDTAINTIKQVIGIK